MKKKVYTKSESNQLDRVKSKWDQVKKYILFNKHDKRNWPSFKPTKITLSQSFDHIFSLKYNEIDSTIWSLFSFKI